LAGVVRLFFREASYDLAGLSWLDLKLLEAWRKGICYYHVWDAACLLLLSCSHRCSCDVDFIFSLGSPDWSMTEQHEPCGGPRTVTLKKIILIVREKNA
jgi:hypothetical protein